MIFTARFGALAARRTFPKVTETDQEHTPAAPVVDAELDQAAETTVHAAA